MIANLERTTGKSFEEWVAIAKEPPHLKHSETVQLLKNTYGLGLFFADLIVHKANGTDAGSFSEEELINNQYKGKENLKPIYDALIEALFEFAETMEIAPKKGYVSLRGKKQFACLKPATKTRFELELILKNQEPSGKLIAITGAGAMCTHRIALTSPQDIDEEVLNWLKLAYQKAI